MTFYKSKNPIQNKNKGEKRKYKNKKVEVLGIEFDSKKESQRWIVLKEAESKGIISNLKRQVKFELIPPIVEQEEIKLKTKTKIVDRVVQREIYYKCDFLYEKNGELIIEDVKASPKVASLDKVFLLKEKLFRWKYGKQIKRIYKFNEKI